MFQHHACVPVCVCVVNLPLNQCQISIMLNLAHIKSYSLLRNISTCYISHIITEFARKCLRAVYTKLLKKESELAYEAPLEYLIWRVFSINFPEFFLLDYPRWRLFFLVFTYSSNVILHIIYPFARNCHLNYQWAIRWLTDLDCTLYILCMIVHT